MVVKNTILEKAWEELGFGQYIEVLKSILRDTCLNPKKMDNRLSKEPYFAIYEVGSA